LLIYFKRLCNNVAQTTAVYLWILIRMLYSFCLHVVKIP